MVIRLLLDVNVWVNHYFSLSKGIRDSAAQRLVRSAFDGQCRLGAIQPIMSHGMLDTLQDVLMRLAFSEATAEAARNAVEAAATGGIARIPPHLVLAGGVQPVTDHEDGRVLDTAIAGGADMLVTNNLKDFAPGSRTGLDADILRADHRGHADIVLLRHARLPHGLIITTVFTARSWLVDGAPPPAGLLDRFRPRT